MVSDYISYSNTNLGVLFYQKDTELKKKSITNVKYPPDSCPLCIQEVVETTGVREEG